MKVAQQSAKKAHGDYHNAAKVLDAELGSLADATGPVEVAMGTYNPGRVSGIVVGAFGEASAQNRDLADVVACELGAEHPALLDIGKSESKAIAISGPAAQSELLFTAHGPSLPSTSTATSSRTYSSRATTRARQARTTPGDMSSFTSTRPTRQGRSQPHPPGLEYPPVLFLGC